MIQTEEDDRGEEVDCDQRIIELSNVHEPEPENETAMLVQADEISTFDKEQGAKLSAGPQSFLRRIQEFLSAQWRIAVLVFAGIAVMIVMVALWLAFVPRLPTVSGASCSLTDSQQPSAVIQPSAYSLSFRFSDRNFEPNSSRSSQEFNASSSMTFRVLQATRTIPLHSVGMTFLSISIGNADGTGLCLCGVECTTGSCESTVSNISMPRGCSSSEVVEISLPSSLSQGARANLSIQYTGQFNSGRGVYRSSPFDLQEGKDREQSVLLVTQLEETGARHLFPCVDEPANKAVFTVDLTYPKGLIALSNTPAFPGVSQQGDKLQKQGHEPTPRMSPYLVAICIGHIVPLRSTTIGGIDVAAWSVPLLQEQLDYPLQIATAALAFYTEYTGVAQPLKKFDLVAVPGKSGAMENWGLLLFDETRFLVNNETEGAYGQWLSADVICHEVAHQWFGNLVTCLDWDQLTVNEGMASFMEYFCLQNVLPEAIAGALMRRAASPMREPIGIHEGIRDTALSADEEPLTASLVSSRKASLRPPKEIIYSKGASILRMLQGYFESIQPSSFQMELQTYLKARLYSTATTDDIIATLAASSALPSAINRTAFRDAMLLWFYQPGIPEIDVIASGTKLGQQRYLEWKSSKEADSQPWGILLQSQNFSGNSSSDSSYLYLLEKEDIFLDDSLNNALVLNYNASGLFRVFFDEDDIPAVASWLKTVNSSNEEAIYTAAATLEDSFAFLHQGSVSMSQFLTLATAISQSPAFNSTLGYYTLAGTVLDCLHRLRYTVNLNSTCIRGLDELVVNLTAKLVNETLSRLQTARDAGGYKQIPFMLRLAQADILRDAALAGSTDAASYLCSIYGDMTSGNTSQTGVRHPDLRGAAYAVASARPVGCNITASASEAFQSFRDCWEDFSDLTEKRRCLFAMAYTRDEASRKTLASLLFEPEYQSKMVSSSTTYALLRIIAQTPEGASDVWQSVLSRLNAVSTGAHNSKGEGSSSSLWSLIDGIQLPPTLEVLEAVRASSRAKTDSSLGLLQLKIQGRVQHAVDLLEAKGPDFCQALVH